MARTLSTVDEIWRRIGLDEPPDFNTAGRGVGVVVVDRIVAHRCFAHLSDRLFRVDTSTGRPRVLRVFDSECADRVPASAMHGVLSLLLLAHQPFQAGAKHHASLCPASTFVFVESAEPPQLELALDHLKCEASRLILNTMVPPGDLGFHRMRDYDYVRHHAAAVESGTLVVAANGNSRAHNNLHPSSFFAVGGYNDGGSADSRDWREHPSVPWGPNSDGHMRPDVLAPFSYLPTPPVCDESNQEVCFFAGTSGGSTTVAGASALLLSMYPDLSGDGTRALLTRSGVRLPDGTIPMPVLRLGAAMHSKETGGSAQPIRWPDPLSVDDAEAALKSDSEIERAVGLTRCIETGVAAEPLLYRSLEDRSPIVKKVAIWGLESAGVPSGARRERLWTVLDGCTSEDVETGVKEALGYALLRNGSTKVELPRWIGLADDGSIGLQLLTNLYIGRHWPDAPLEEIAPDPDAAETVGYSQRLRAWYQRSHPDAIAPSAAAEMPQSCRTAG